VAAHALGAEIDGLHQLRELAGLTLAPTQELSVGVLASFRIKAPAPS
jgi:hypothetical protein